MDLMKVVLKLDSFFITNNSTGDIFANRTLRKNIVLSNLSVNFEYLDQMVR